jgi:conjugative transposon TraM protein
MKHSEKFLQQRRFYMMLPVLVLPFITMIFWALGGGQGAAAQVQESGPGLNLELPGAHFDKDDELWDKFSLYEQAKRDSIKYAEARKNDPYYEISMLTTNVIDTVPEASILNTSLGSKKKKDQLDANAALINHKLQQLTEEIEQPHVARPTPAETVHAAAAVAPDTSMSADVDRLEKMMQMMSSGSSEDPEMKQINGMLDKILDVQHPERVNERLKAEFPKSHKDLLEVKPALKEDNISLVDSKSTALLDADPDSPEFSEPVAQNSFYGLDDEANADSETGNSMDAVVHGTQSVVAGSTIKMRLLSDVTIKGQTIRKGQFIYGVCSISGERLIISINSLRNENMLLPVSLKVFDLDGLEGIYTPGAITRDAAKQATNNSIQEVQLSSLDNSIGMQAATAGVSAAKGLFSKKVKLIKVTVKAGYHILLKDANQKI